MRFVDSLRRAKGLIREQRRRARRADAAGDPASAEQLRRDAQRLYTQIDATG